MEWKLPEEMIWTVIYLCARLENKIKVFVTYINEKKKKKPKMCHCYDKEENTKNCLAGSYEKWVVLKKSITQSSI